MCTAAPCKSDVSNVTVSDLLTYLGNRYPHGPIEWIMDIPEYHGASARSRLYTMVHYTTILCGRSELARHTVRASDPLATVGLGA